MCRFIPALSVPEKGPMDGIETTLLATATFFCLSPKVGSFVSRLLARYAFHQLLSILPCGRSRSTAVVG
jgi:hypothetical protein